MPLDQSTHLRLGMGGGQTLPSQIILCAHCRKPRPEEEMVIETNPESPVFGLLCCSRDTCFEGPGPSYLNATPLIDGPDEIGPPTQNTRW